MIGDGNIITAVHIEVTNTVGWISDFFVSYSEESLWVIKREHDAHMEYFHEVNWPAMREREREIGYESVDSDAGDDDDPSEQRNKSRRSRRSGRARKRLRHFQDEIQRCASPGSDLL